MIETALPLVITGFISRWATGVDDVLALSLLLRGQSRRMRRSFILGTVLALLAVLTVATLIVLGVLSFAPQALRARALGVPLQNLTGLIPVLIGARSLYLLAKRTEDDNGDEVEEIESRLKLAAASLVGFQIKLLNSTDDVAVHVSLLLSASGAPMQLVAYWAGVLLGEATTIVSARWLADRMETRRLLDALAAVAVVVVGALVLLGVFADLT